MEEVQIEDYQEIAEVFRALGHPIRLCIVRGLVQSKGCNVKKMQNCLGVPQSSVSQHLAKLKASGIIEGEKKGTEIIYRVKDSRTRSIINFIFPEGQ